MLMLVALGAIGSPPAVADEPSAGGTPTADGAPQLSGGRYRETLPDSGGAKHYVISVVPGSSLHVAAVVFPGEETPGARGGLQVDLKLLPQGADPLRCPEELGPGSVAPLGVTSVPASLDVAVDRAGEGQRPGCGDTTFALSLNRGADLGPSPFVDGPIPVEMTVRIEPPVDDAVLPRAAMEARPPVTVPDATEPVTAIGGGATPFSAPEIVPGVTYRDAAIGGIRYYKVRLRWGQRFGFRLRPNALGCFPSRVPASMYAGVLNPLHERLSDVGQLGFVASPSDVLEASMPYPVRYTHRLIPDGDRPDYAFDGFHYLIVRSEPEADEVPYDLVVAVDGSVEPGPVALGSLSAADDTAPAAAPAPAFGCDPTPGGIAAPAVERAVRAGFFATLVVVGVVAAVAVVRHRRRR